MKRFLSLFIALMGFALASSAEPEPTDNYYLVGSFNNWNLAYAELMEGNTITIPLSKGTHTFKVVTSDIIEGKPGSENSALGCDYIDPECSSEGVECDGEKIKVTLSDDGDLTVTFVAGYLCITGEFSVGGAEPDAADVEAANAVIGKINAIGTVEITDACKAKVNDARTAYKALTDAQKALITSEQYKVLTDAEGVFSKNTLLAAIVAKEGTYAPIVSRYFKDAACTELKDDYKVLDDDMMLEYMTAEGLPEAVQEMVMGIRNGWAGEYNAEQSKRFRIQDYDLCPTAAATKTSWEGSLYGDFNGATGIVANGNQLIFVFVGDNVPANTSLSLVGTSVAGTTRTTETLSSGLKKGMNIILNNRNNNYLWIMYTTADNTVKVSEQAPMKIHIEGGYAMGYADLGGLAETDAQAEYGSMLTYANGLAEAKNISKNSVFPVMGNAGEMCFALSAYGQVLSSSNVYQSVGNSDKLIMAYHNSLGITDETYADYIGSYTPAFLGADADADVCNVISLALQLGAPEKTDAYTAKADAVVTAYQMLTKAQQLTIDPTLVTLVQYALKSIQTTTAIDAPAAEKAVKAYKTVENGEIVIVKGGERFNLRGAKIE